MTKEDHEAHNTELRYRSGRVDDQDSFVSLLYSLLRDGAVAPGLLEELTRAIVHAANMDSKTTLYSNGYLAKYCQDVVARLRAVDDKTWRQQAAASQTCTHPSLFTWHSDVGVNDTMRVDWCRNCGSIRQRSKDHDDTWRRPGSAP